ncbi:MAG: ATP-dependent helicase [Candidatus Woesearchaeota archaeon]
MKINKAQEKAILKTEGPCVILAGAGTGKSHTIRQKIKHMVDINLYKPADILCLTFSNEATNSLRKKISEDLNSFENVTVKTFHSFCGDILREHGHKIGIDAGFEILLEDDAKIFLHKYYKVEPYWASRYVKTISSTIDLEIEFEEVKKHRDKLFSEIDDVNKYDEIYFNLQTLHLKDIPSQEKSQLKKEYVNFIKKFNEWKKFDDYLKSYDNYIQFKKERNYLDFADLNYYVLKLFRMFGSDEYVDKFKYVFVDEFQDTNKLQFELIEYIAMHKNITVVGDMNQSIYGFRGSYKDSFNDFIKHFNVTDDDIIKLDLTYRNTNNISKVSHKLIQNNYENPEDCLFIKNADDIDGDKVNIVSLKNMDEEARYIADVVDEKIKQGVSMKEIYVLYRTHKQSEIIKQALEMKNIPVITSGRTNMLQRREIKTAIAYLSVLNNLYTRTGTGEQAWWDFFHYQNTLSPIDSLKIGRKLKKSRDNEGKSIDELLLETLDIDISSNAKKIVSRIIDSLHKTLKVSNKPLPELILDIFEISGLNRAFTYERTAYNVECLMNLKKFYSLAENFYKLHEKGLDKFIEYLEIIDKLGVNVDSSKIVKVDAVKMMTIHASKGLEAEVVIISNLAEKRFPLDRTSNEPLIPRHLRPHLKDLVNEWISQGLSEKEIEEKIKNEDALSLEVEERRLCYVAMTRASKELFMTYARSYNNEEDSALPSIFLEEIEFSKNENVNFVMDDEEKSFILSPTSSFEIYKKDLKKQLIEHLDTEDFKTLLERLMYYVACREKEVVDFKTLLSEFEFDMNQLKEYIDRVEKDSSLLVFDKDFTFSPTSISAFLECPKKFELSKLLNMPERGAFGESAASFGSFVHQVLENGVSKGFVSKEEFISEAEKLRVNEDLDRVNKMIDVFWERNKDKIKNSSVEVPLSLDLEGYKFFGFADRIDENSDGLEIIDYKTGKEPDKLHREIQLGFYALALMAKGKDVSKVTLEMLNCEKPVSFKNTGNGCFVDDIGRAHPFNVNAVRETLLRTCKEIEKCYQTKFECVEDEGKCMFCGYKFYCPKWEEE